MSRDTYPVCEPCDAKLNEHEEENSGQHRSVSSRNHCSGDPVQMRSPVELTTRTHRSQVNHCTSTIHGETVGGHDTSSDVRIQANRVLQLSLRVVPLGKNWNDR